MRICPDKSATKESCHKHETAGRPLAAVWGRGLHPYWSQDPKKVVMTLPEGKVFHMIQTEVLITQLGSTVVK